MHKTEIFGGTDNPAKVYFLFVAQSALSPEKWLGNQSLRQSLDIIYYICYHGNIFVS